MADALTSPTPLPDGAEPATGRSINQRVLDLMIERIDLLNSVGTALSSEKDPRALQEHILLGSKLIARADGGTLYEVDHETQQLRFVILRTDSLGIAMGGSSGKEITLPPVPLHRPDGTPNHASVVAHAVLSGRTVNIVDAYDATGFDFSGTRAFDARTGYRSRSMLTVPMKDHEGRIIGVLQLLNAQAGDGKTVIPFSRPVQRMVESLASQAAIALTRERLIAGMHDLFAAFVRLIAHAIDEKSRHTGAHCQRVPELTMMIAEAATRCGEGPLAGFAMSEDDRRELQIAALLHDCGKVATPDWIMDKATKLQTVVDRIGLIETRAEVLKRDAEICRLQALLSGQDADQAAAECRAEVQAIEADLAVLRRVNRGGELLAPADRERILAIAERTWTSPAGLTEPFLTADEVENLCIERGTLTERERQVIQDHVRVTIAMLESLPYPRHLQRVPEFAGGHHERCDGKGYPRGLKREQMSIQARMMALADVFEALTAADRPYKKPMTLSQALRVLKGMVVSGHIDPDIFALFVRSGAYRTYAERFLKPEQMDVIDEAGLLA